MPDHDAEDWTGGDNRPRWKVALTNVASILLGLAILAAVVAWGYVGLTHRPNDGYRDGYDGPDRADQFYNR